MARPIKQMPKSLDVAAGLGALRTRLLDGERLVAAVLRVGALLAGGLFLLSVVLLAVGGHAAWVAVERLQRAGLTVLVATPVLRLVVSGVMLGVAGEWRYAVYAVTVLVLLGLSVGAGITH